MAAKDLDDALPTLETLFSSSTEVATEQPSSTPELPIQQTKKAKLQEKRQAFLQSTLDNHYQDSAEFLRTYAAELEPSKRQVSKSTARRMKRKAREQLTGDLNDLQQAIATLEEESTIEDASMQTIADANSAEQREQSSKPSTKKGLIGKGGSAPLSKNQRKRAL